jgi:hypothetical protein
VFSDKHVIYLRQRQLDPTVFPGMSLSAHHLRISSLEVKSFQTSKIGRVTLRGRVMPGSPSNPVGIMNTPPAGVPIPHETELLPFGGGGAVAIAQGSTLLPSSQPMPVGTVHNPDGSTLGMGTVRFTEARVAMQSDLEAAAWRIPVGTLVRPDGLMTYVDGSFEITVPPGFADVLNHNGTVTRLHP